MKDAVQQELNPLRLLFHSTNNNDEFSEKITDFFPAIIYIYDADTRKLKYINRKITEVLGYTHEDVAGWNDDITNIVYKEDLDIVKQELEKFYSLDGDESHSYNARLTHKQGNWKYFRTMGTVLSRSLTGKTNSLLFVAQDVTDEVLSGMQFRRIEDLFNDTQDILKFGIWEWDVPGKAITWTNGLYKLLGYDPLKEKDSLVITPQFFLSHVLKEDRDKVLQSENYPLNYNEYDTYYQVCDRNGRIKDVREKAKVIRNSKNEVLRVIGSTMDVTEQLKVNRELEEYKAMKQENEEFLLYGTWEYDALKEKYFWSDGMYRLFGYDPEIARKKLTISEELYKKHMDPDHFERSKLIRDSLLKNKSDEEHYSWEYEITCAHGIKKRIETYGKVVIDKNGKWIKTVGTTRDITKLHEFRESLEEKIKDLNRSNKELEEFAYIASHDMNEPLRKITTFIERLEKKHKSDLGTEGKLYIDRIVASVDNMRLLIDTLLEFSRTTRNDQPFEKTNLHVILSSVKADLDLKIEESSAKIETTALPVIEAVPAQMKQLFNNFLNNSIKFKKPGVSAHISIKSSKLNRNDKEAFKLDEENTYFKIDITDNGIGFEPEYKDRIFRIFQRLHGKTEYPGSGIGLAICKKIADHHKGVIYATGEPGNGATFTVILPESQ